MPDSFNDTRYALTRRTGGIERMSSRLLSGNRLSITIEGRILEPMERPAYGYNDMFNDVNPVGRPEGYVAAHLWGPGFGDEAYAGIMYAPVQVNNVLQSSGNVRGIERWIQVAAAEVRALGGELHVRARADAYPKANPRDPLILQSVTYEVAAQFPDGSVQRRTISVEVTAPPNGVGTVELPIPFQTGEGPLERPDPIPRGHDPGEPPPSVAPTP
jgi:hypothetical protein